MDKILSLLLLITPTLSLSQSLIFPEGVIEVFHDNTDTEYMREEGDGESRDSAPVFYIPIASNNSALHETTQGLSASLSGTPIRSTLSIPVEISISDGGQTWDAFIAAKKNGTEQYQVIYNQANVTNGQSLTLTPNLDDICDEDDDLDLNCSKFQQAEEDREEITLFMGVGVQGEVDHTVGSSDSIDPENYPEGYYITLKMSSEITTTAPVLDKIYKGERRLKVFFQGIKINDVDSLYAYIQDLGKISTDKECDLKAPPPASSYQNLPDNDKEKHKKLNSKSEAGAVFIRNLKNRYCYSIQLYYRDKYQFTTHVSNGRNASPELLIKLLEKNSCFLLTAGFGGDDPLIDDFRHFRDHTLSHTPWGRAFIHFYYRHAPTYAPALATSPLLSALIRTTAHIFHGLFLKKTNR